MSLNEAQSTKVDACIRHVEQCFAFIKSVKRWKWTDTRELEERLVSLYYDDLIGGDDPYKSFYTYDMHESVTVRLADLVNEALPHLSREIKLWDQNSSSAHHGHTETLVHCVRLVLALSIVTGFSKGRFVPSNATAGMRRVFVAAVKFIYDVLRDTQLMCAEPRMKPLLAQFLRKLIESVATTHRAPFSKDFPDICDLIIRFFDVCEGDYEFDEWRSILGATTIVLPQEIVNEVAVAPEVDALVAGMLRSAMRVGFWPPAPKPSHVYPNGERPFIQALARWASAKIGHSETLPVEHLSAFPLILDWCTDKRTFESAPRDCADILFLWCRAISKASKNRAQMSGDEATRVLKFAQMILSEQPFYDASRSAMTLFMALLRFRIPHNEDFCCALFSSALVGEICRMLSGEFDLPEDRPVWPLIALSLNRDLLAAILTYNEGKGAQLFLDYSIEALSFSTTNPFHQKGARHDCALIAHALRATSSMERMSYDIFRQHSTTIAACVDTEPSTMNAARDNLDVVAHLLLHGGESQDIVETAESLIDTITIADYMYTPWADKVEDPVVILPWSPEGWNARIRVFDVILSVLLTARASDKFCRMALIWVLTITGYAPPSASHAVFELKARACYVAVLLSDENVYREIGMRFPSLVMPLITRPAPTLAAEEFICLALWSYLELSEEDDLSTATCEQWLEYCEAILARRVRPGDGHVREAAREVVQLLSASDSDSETDQET